VDVPDHHAGDITLLLRRADQNDPQAAEQILVLVYDELRRLAAAKMARESAGQTLQPTALVHEAWLRLGGDQQPTWQNRAHFFAAAAEAMRRILIENARRKGAQRHGGGRENDVGVAQRDHRVPQRGRGERGLAPRGPPSRLSSARSRARRSRPGPCSYRRRR
jgi:RNA polymerase sigma factor (TIGR02999 family)